MMIQPMECGDKYSLSKIDVNSSLIQLNSHHDNPSLHVLLSKLNIPINCLDNQQIRQHYLDEYSAKYSKAKHLLSNARKKQRKIIMTYYEKKEKQDNIDELQIVKQSLTEENDKIKKFKEALKDKLIIYQQRLQFLKDAEFWSALESQQLQNNTTESIETYTDNSPDSPARNDSLHLLHDNEKIQYTENFLDDSYPMNTELIMDDSKPNLQFDDMEINQSSRIAEDQSLIEINLRYQEQLHSQIDENDDTSISKNDVTDDQDSRNKRTKDYFPWFKNNSQVLFLSSLRHHFDRFEIVSMILMISLAIFLVIFINYLLEYFLIYLTKSSVSSITLPPPPSSPPPSPPISLFTYLLSNIYNCTTSWLLPFFRLFEFSV